MSSRGWCILEERIINANGAEPEHFAHAFRKADSRKKAQLLHSLKRLLVGLISNSVRLYDPQNIVVQNLQDGKFELRLMDFEPSGRCLIPIDALLPAFIRMKSFRRARRWMQSHLRVKVGTWIRFFKSQRVVEQWDSIIATEGAAMGLSECSVFLENKLVNDIFYEGLYQGVPCVVKCSSKAPDSILNEYEVLNRLYSINSDVFPKPMARYCSQDGRLAFVVTEKLNQVEGITSDSAAQDILAIALALKESGIVHRDIFVDNLMLGSDGHLKLIDFQFAIDRNDYRESVFMLRNPTYHYVTFGGEGKLGLGKRNDLLGFGLIRCLDLFAPNAKDIRECLVEMEREFFFEEKISVFVRWRLWLHEKSLAFRLLFNKKDALHWRYQKLKRLLSL